MSEPDARAGRPDTDDYDLLTYGEASARLAELLAVEQGRLVALRIQTAPDQAAIQRLEQRISLLESSSARYRQQSLTAEAFTLRFGFRPRDDSAKGRR